MRDRLVKRMQYLAWKKSGPWKPLFYAAKQRCCNPKTNYYKKGFVFELSMQDIKHFWVRDNAVRLKKPSLDRIDNTKGYTFDNCRIIELDENRYRRNKLHLKTPIGWSVDHEKCVVCGTSSLRHQAKGMCNPCYRKRQYKENPFGSNPLKRICKLCGKVFLVKRADAKKGRGTYCSRICFYKYIGKIQPSGKEER